MVSDCFGMKYSRLNLTITPATFCQKLVSENVKNELEKLKMGTQKLNKSQVNALGLPQTTLLHI